MGKKIKIESTESWEMDEDDITAKGQKCHFCDFIGIEAFQEEPDEAHCRLFGDEIDSFDPVRLKECLEKFGCDGCKPINKTKEEV